MFEPGEVSAGAPQLAGGRGTTELHRQQPQGDFPQGGRRGGGGKALRGEAGAGEEGGGGGEGGQKVARERWVAFAQSSLSRVSGEIKSDSVGDVSLLHQLGNVNYFFILFFFVYKCDNTACFFHCINFLMKISLIADKT